MISSLEEELTFQFSDPATKGRSLMENTGQLMLPLFREIVDANQVAVEAGEKLRLSEVPSQLAATLACPPCGCLASKLFFRNLSIHSDYSVRRWN